jgi:glycerol-3-phosphate acyltransferase PlsX
MRRIAFDAMGGDHAPGHELDAVVAVLREGRKDLGIILVGDEAQLREGLKQRGASVWSDHQLTIRHASQVVTMEDSPSSPVRSKKDSSMRVCFDLVKSKQADAVVSAGNSGAMLACGLFVLKRLPGALRPGIVTTFPTLTGECVLCDMGANVDVQPETLAEFGVLGAVFAQVMGKKKRPKVGVLSNGEEESKGTELTRQASAILKKIAADGAASFDFVGYVEGRDIFGGEIDVVATDGFTGNVVLKTAEGAAQALVELLKKAFASSTSAKVGALLARPALRAFKKKLDYAETGGAPLLGVDGLALVCHGRSSGHALKNAILAAASFAERELVRHVAEELARHEVFARADEKVKASP